MLSGFLPMVIDLGTRPANWTTAQTLRIGPCGPARTVSAAQANSSRFERLNS
jgi:hypothetical protein